MLLCPRCSTRFDEQKLCPRLLACGHSVCTACLGVLVEAVSPVCPACSNPLSAKSVHAYPKHLAVLDALLSDLSAAPSRDLMCVMCDETHPATSTCLECNEHMCQDAARFHTRSRASRDHHLVALSTSTSSPAIVAAEVLLLS